MDQTQTSPHITPTTALLLALLYSSSVALQEHLYTPMLLPLLLLGWFQKESLLSIFKRLFFLNTLIAIVVLSMLWQKNYDLALLVFLRSNFILMFILMLFQGKDEFAIAIAMHRLRLPHKLTSIFFFTAKSIFLIKREFSLFKNTLHVRGFTPKTNILTYKTMAGFVGILFIKALERSVLLQKAMQLRGYCGEVYTLEEHQAFTKQDTLLALITILSLLWRQGALI
ncbi:MAG: ABC-type cobalt transport system, permease component CbiQ [Proteobacteria bacterium]|nr:ABC-type cobalt transport system, permease component CbiQ [Pseudomonadota bacterium]